MTEPLSSLGAPRPTAAFPWIRRKERLFLFLGIGIQILLLIGMIVYRFVPLAIGQTILVQVHPVDPWDPFRGEYVELGYDFSRYPLDDRRDRRPLKRGQIVYTLLKPSVNGEYWVLDRHMTQPPVGGIFLRGCRGWNDQINYGIEQYYLPEGRGTAIEQAIRSNRVFAEIAVLSNGRAALKRLVIRDR